jgi:2-polyprenyl-3-methyl-5-hydroxy-6-metoxy-1,4-benzoquinol methylase
LGCGVCGGGPLTRVLELRDHEGRPTWLGRCPACGLVQASERPTNEELERYYSQYCYSREASWVLPEATLVSLGRVAALLRPYRELNRCLDVGCGAGAFLTALSRDGWAAEGTELSGVAALRLEGMGFRVHRGAIEDLQLEPERYDVAVLSEVLEHLRDPRAALQNTVRALRRGGVVYLTTPNYDALSRRVLRERWRVVGVPEHLYYFSPRSLAALLAAVGLTPVRIWTEGLNPYELLACWRARAQPVQAVVEAAQSQGEALRLMAVRRPWVRALKSFVNLGLRASGLGDTLKCVAARA